MPRGRRQKRRKSLISQGLSWVGGRNRTRTCDPIDVNDVLYRLSHATVYINYDGYAIYSMTECRWRSSVDECQRRKFLPKIQRIC